MPRVYIAGPMRGQPQSNFPAFDRAASLGRALGWDVISPADMDRANGDDAEANPLPFNGGSPETNRMYARRDTDAILSLKAEDGDAIALLPGWRHSTAAPAELGLARWVKLKVLDALTFLPLDARLEGVELRPKMPAQFQQCGIEGCCGLEQDLATAATIRIADDFANRETV